MGQFSSRSFYSSSILVFRTLILSLICCYLALDLQLFYFFEYISGDCWIAMQSSSLYAFTVHKSYIGALILFSRAWTLLFTILKSFGGWAKNRGFCWCFEDGEGRGVWFEDRLRVVWLYFRWICSWTRVLGVLPKFSRRGLVKRSSRIHSILLFLLLDVSSFMRECVPGPGLRGYFYAVWLR